MDMRKDVFICHAFEDKKDIATPLANELAKYYLDLFYDDFELLVGDSLEEIIDKGLEESRYGILIISPVFLEKVCPQNSTSGILKKELDSLATKEVDGKKVILPIWHKVGKAEVDICSSALARRYALKSDDGIPIIAQKLIRVIDDGNYLTKIDIISIGKKFRKENPFKMAIERPEERDNFWEVTVKSNTNNNLQHPTLRVVFYTFDSLSFAKYRYLNAKEEDYTKVESWGERLLITEVGEESYGYICQNCVEGWINGIVVYRRYNVMVRIEHVIPLNIRKNPIDDAEHYAQHIDLMIVNVMNNKGIIIP